MNTTHIPRTFTPGTIRWLSAAGHPGYSRAFAQRVLARMVHLGADPRDLRQVSAYAFQASRG